MPPALKQHPTHMPFVNGAFGVMNSEEFERGPSQLRPATFSVMQDVAPTRDNANADPAKNLIATCGAK